MFLRFELCIDEICVIMCNDRDDIFGTICVVRGQTSFFILWFKCNLDVMVSYRLERGDAMDVPHRPAVTINYP